MKKVDYYILKEFISSFLIVSLIFVLISLIVDIFENLNRFIDNKVSSEILIKYYLTSLPSMLSLTIPVSCLVSTVFTYGMMIQRKEWLVLKSSGLSLYRLSIPVLYFGLIMSACSFYFDNSVVVKSNKTRNELKNTFMSKNNRMIKKNLYENIYFQINDKDLIAIEKFNSNNNVALNLNFIQVKNGILYKRIDSKKSQWKKNNLWNLENFSIREFDKYGTEKNVVISKNDSLVKIDINPRDILKTANDSDEISFSMLKEQIITLENNGVNSIRWKVDLNYKIAYSLISIIVIFCGIPLSVYRSNTSLAFGGGLSLATIFAYVIILKFGQSLAYAGVLSPFFGAWLSNLIFICIGIYLMLNARK